MYRPISYLIANAIETVPPISASLLKSTEIYKEINRIAQDLHLMLCFSFFSFPLLSCFHFNCTFWIYYGAQESNKFKWLHLIYATWGVCCKNKAKDDLGLGRFEFRVILILHTNVNANVAGTVRRRRNSLCCGLSCHTAAPLFLLSLALLWRRIDACFLLEMEDRQLLQLRPGLALPCLASAWLGLALLERKWSHRKLQITQSHDINFRYALV